MRFTTLDGIKTQASRLVYGTPSSAGSGDLKAALRDYLTELQMPVFTYSSLARGFLSGKYKSDSKEPIENILWEGTIKEYYAEENIIRLQKVEQLSKEIGCTVPQLAMAWVLHQPMNLFPITTPTGEDHVREVVAALDIKLNEEQLAFMCYKNKK